MSRRTWLGIGALGAGLAAALAMWAWPSHRSGAPLTGSAAPTHVGRQVCAQCHAQAERRWRGSHHDLAMQPASETTVAGDFNGARFTYAGVTSTFTRREGKFVVRTDGADGQLRDFEVAYTFGAVPLQQYLIALPDGRLQALSIAWDARPRTRGGQRWFHLYPGQNVTHRDELHWTGPGQNWNFMCAECHSTGVRKNYDATTRRFATEYAEVNVSCEACHGPGSRHAAWARKEGDWRRLDGTKGLTVALDERKAATWAIDAATGNAKRTPARATSREVETCGRCHARRAQFAEDVTPGRPLGDTHRVALLEDALYHPDGQIREEVYEYGSFLQSKMFSRGVTCSDCHEPHSGKLRAPRAQVCLGCHASGKYWTPKHHFHQVGSRGADCVSCHMPTTTYMVVDPRHDHSFRVPRPDLSVTLGVPNACTGCHTGRPAEWAARQVQTWYKRAPRGHQRFAEALAAAALGAPGAVPRLETVARDGEQPAIARASALARLGGPASTTTLETLRAGLADADPLVRRAAARSLVTAAPTAHVAFLIPLLEDPVRVVRMDVARALAAAPRDRLTDAQRAALDRARAEYVAAQRFNADRPESHLNLALLYAAEQQPAEAEAALRRALDLEPRFVPAAVNLADLYRATGRDVDGEKVLRAALEHSPRSAAARHALGLLLVRDRRVAAGLPELEAAARIAPENARYGYVYAVALHDGGRGPEAIVTLTRVLGRHPYDRDTLTALVTYAREAGDVGGALGYARRLAALEPSDAQIGRLVRSLEAEAAGARPRPAP